MTVAEAALVGPMPEKSLSVIHKHAQASHRGASDRREELRRVGGVGAEGEKTCRFAPCLLETGWRVSEGVGVTDRDGHITVCWRACSEYGGCGTDSGALRVGREATETTSTGRNRLASALGSTKVAPAPSSGAQGASSQIGAHSPIGAQGSTKVIGAYGSNEDGGAYNAVRPATTEASPGETCMMTAASIYGEDAVVERGEAAGPNHGAAAATAPSPEGDKSSRIVAGDDLEPRRGSDLTCMMTAASKYGGDTVVPLEVDVEMDEAEEKLQPLSAGSDEAEAGRH